MLSSAFISFYAALTRAADHSPTFSEEERQSRLAGALNQLLVTAHQLGMSAAEVHAAIDQCWNQPLDVQE